MHGRGGWFARGHMGWGRGVSGWGVGAYGAWPGNPYSYCRNFPWLPRGWWWTGAYGASYPWGGMARWPVGYGAYPVNPYYQAPQTQA